MGRSLETLAKQDADKAFDMLIQDSLDNGDGWIHKHLKGHKKTT